MSVVQTAKLWLVDNIGLAKDALHIHIGLLIFFGTALLFRWPIRGWKPWLLVAMVVLAGEGWDIYETVQNKRPIILDANWKDVWNTLLWPTVLSILAGATALSMRRRRFRPRG